MNWKKGGLWILIFFIVKGTVSTLLIITGAKYFKLTIAEILILVIILLVISIVGRKFLQRRKKVKNQNDVNI